ncbi:unnamed protein product [Larinioides sclopetarius]|uniref:BPTI/Kunitz inhibitor domain-containing protein n=1 Tax=Larinioides sclopetarius TaxID=280406 RepID=A0AAV2BRI6_9ARAC
MLLRNIKFCEIPSNPGDCEALITRFYYDSVEERCKEFIYGGCGGNSNNFETEEECKAICGGKDMFFLSYDYI